MPYGRYHVLAYPKNDHSVVGGEKVWVIHKVADALWQPGISEGKSLVPAKTVSDRFKLAGQL